MPALIIDPALQAAVIRQFNLRGELAPFNLTENVVPVFDIGALTGNLPTVVTTLAGSQGLRIGTLGGNPYLVTESPRYDDTDVVDSRSVTNPTAGQVLADSGQLSPANQQLCAAVISSDGALSDFSIQWRDAANAVTLASWTFILGTAGTSSVNWGKFNLNFSNNERIRIVSDSAVTGDVAATIMTVNISPSEAS